jgi:hypothetical protein
LQRSEGIEQEVIELSDDVNGSSKLVAELNREIASGGSTMANIRENLRVRKLQAEIDATQAEINTYDLEGAAQAKQNFEERYAREKKKEDSLHGEVGVASIRGECTCVLIVCSVFCHWRRARVRAESSQRAREGYEGL